MVSIYVSIVGALASELILSGKLKGLQSSQGESNNKKHSYHTSTFFISTSKLKYNFIILM